VTPLMLN